jgi:hypothetical protein
LFEFDGEVSLRLAPSTRTHFEAWETEVESMLGDEGCLETMRDWGGKLAGATLRLAGVLHCVVYGPSGEIDGETLTSAIEIGRYLIPHADAVLNLMQAQDGSGDEDARYVLRWIRRHGRREFTKSEAQHHGKRRFPKADDIDPALAELTRRGYIRPRAAETTGPGRRPSPAFLTNPAVFSGITAEKRSHNSHNWDEESEEDVSGNIGSASEQVDSADRVQVKI